MPEKLPSVSVVMGVYNGVEYLRETIDSVLDQSFIGFEMIIINDGSTDSSVVETLSDYSSRDSRVKIISKGHAGLTCALVDGCNIAGGEYIARIDVGDKMEPQRLQMQKEILDRYLDCHLVSSHVQFCAPGWEKLWVSRARPQTKSPVSIVSSEGDRLDGDVSHHGSVMFRKSAYQQVGGYRKAFYYGQDWDLWYRLAEIGEYYVVPEVLYVARYFPDALSMRNSGRQSAIARCSLDAHKARKQKKSEKLALNRAKDIRPSNGAASNNNLSDGFYFIGEALRTTGNAASRGYFIKAIKDSPLHLKSYFRLLQSIF